MIRYRQSSNSQVELAIVQVVRGLGAGCIGFPVQAAIQSAAKHERESPVLTRFVPKLIVALSLRHCCDHRWVRSEFLSVRS